jgi:hypothetical protein
MALWQISFISMVGFSVCISSRNLIIANFSRCVRGRPDPCFRKLTLVFILNLKVIGASVAQAPLHQNG